MGRQIFHGASRYEQLDSLRGIAALSVGLSHHLQVFQGVAPGTFPLETKLARVAKFAPTYGLVAGYESVVLFFVLSGFVLTLPWLRGQPPRYGIFVLRRLARLYIPYAAALLFATSLCAVTWSMEVPATVGPWIAKHWNDPPTAGTVLDHALLVHHFDVSRYSPVFWSLVVEMRLSLVFPLIAWIATRWSARAAIGTSLSLSLVSCGLWWTHDHLAVDVATTLHYLGIFVLGGLAARYFDRLRARYRASAKWVRWGVPIAAILFYDYGRIVAHAVPFFTDWLIAPAAVAFFVCAFETRVGAWICGSRVAVFLGNISFSYYLVHTTVLYASFRLLGGRVPVHGIVLTSLVGGILVAWGFNRAIEAPALALSRHLRPRAAAVNAVASQ